MRHLTSHKVNGCNEKLDIMVMDEPGDGGACHEYYIAIVNEHGARLIHTKIRFQNGPIPESGVNGVTQEAVLAIVKDRLEGFQSGEFACEENQKALEGLHQAIHWLHHRTLRRIAAGVEGTHKPDDGKCVPILIQVHLVRKGVMMQCVQREWLRSEVNLLIKLCEEE